MLIETFDLMIERTIGYKEKHGADSIYDLQYADIMRDPIAALRRLYEHFGEPLSAEAADAMMAYMAANPKGKHGRHDYRLEDYGLTADRVRRHYRDYCECFGIPQKA